MKPKLSSYIFPIIIVSVALYLFDQSLRWLNGYALQDLNTELQKIALYFLYSFVIGYANILVIFWLEQKYSWKTEPKIRAILGIISSVSVSILAIFILRIITVLGFEGKNWQYFLAHEQVVNYYYSLLISLVIVLGFYSFYFYKQISKHKIQEYQVTAKTETAKFESLKSQLDPHFLFNSLNVLTSLIEENPKQAELFTTQLSQVYRYVLEQKDKDLVPLDDELHFAKVYMDLLKMRFEDAVFFYLPEDLYKTDYKIVPLSLQLSLENAVKHNVIATHQPLKISFFIENAYLTIKNNFNAKSTLQKSSGIGLQNIKERYALLTDKKISIEKDEEFFSIKLPLLTQKSKIMNTNSHTEPSEKYMNARKKVEKMKEFYTNLIAYLIVIPALAIINYKTFWGFKWFFFPMIGWGIGLAFHYFDAFGYDYFLGKNWEERKMKELMNEQDQEKWV